MTPLVLLPSPLLGPAVWEPVAALLRGGGHLVVVPRLPEARTTPGDVLAGYLEALPHGPVTLVPHSNAGLYVAALAAAHPVAAVVFVDAGVPRAAATTPVAPPALRSWLGTLADDGGRLPPWTRWWPEADVERLFPDASSRAAVEAEQPRLPLGYVEDMVPTPSGWERLPVGYVAFGDAYAEEIDHARRHGWPVETLPGDHLHQLVDPRAVADAIERVLGRVRGAPAPG